MKCCDSEFCEKPSVKTDIKTFKENIIIHYQTEMKEKVRKEYTRRTR